MNLKEAAPASPHIGGAVHGVFSVANKFGYTRDEPKSFPQIPEMDPDIENQLISRAIDVLFWDHPELVKDKKIKRHYVNMLIGKITSGDVKNAIDINNVIKALKKRRIKVENNLSLKSMR